MRIGNFSALIPEGREHGSGHVDVAHGQQYTLRLGNHQHRACDAEVTIDGKPVGQFRLNAHGSMTLERPAHDAGRFTFYRAGSGEAVAAGEASVAPDSRGLVQVVFRPERERVQYHPAYSPPAPLSCRVPEVWAKNAAYDGGTTQTDAYEREVKTSGGILRSAAAGVTGLSGHSQQTFYDVAALEHDPAGTVTITLRLVAVADGQRELIPMAARGNPVPAPV